MAVGQGDSVNGTNVWKWISAVLATALISGAPAYATVLFSVARSPTRADFSVLGDRQQNILQRLSAIDVELTVADADRADIHAQLAALRDLLSQRQGGNP